MPCTTPTTHVAVRAVVEAETGPLFLPTILLAELDYLLTTRLGRDAELDFLEGLTDGAFVLIHPTADDLLRCRELVAQYRDLPLGLADASVVATSERLRIPRTLERSIRSLRCPHVDWLKRAKGGLSILHPRIERVAEAVAEEV